MGIAARRWQRRQQTAYSSMPSKLAAPFFANQLGADVNNTVATQNKSQAQWDQVADWYRDVHFEGHNWSRIIDSDNQTGAEKFTSGRPNHRASIYINGSYVTQGSPWFPFRMAAHLERHYPLAISTLDTTNGMLLSGAINATATTISLTVPTSKPSGLPANHLNGTPSGYWPLIGSTLLPSATTYSQNTANYVSWVRIGDEMIGLPLYDAGTWSTDGTTMTIQGALRGLWGTTASSHNNNVKVRCPVYIGSAAASPTDAGLSGNPVLDSTSAPLRYGVNFWDAARLGGSDNLGDGIAYLADIGRAELEAADLAAYKTISNVSGATFTTSVSHGYANDQRVMLAGYDMPDGIRSLRPYWTINVTSTTFQLASTQGGSAITPISSNTDNCVVVRLRRASGDPVTNTVWWDVSSVQTYNNADPYGNDMTAQGSIVDLPYDFTNGTNNTAWYLRQSSKRAPLMQRIADYGVGSVNAYANNYNVSGAAVNNRLTAMGLGNYDGYPLEHFGMEPGFHTYQINHLMNVMRGVNDSGTVINVPGHKAFQWAKCYDWKGGVFDAASADQYIRFNYGIWLCAWRQTATSPKLLIKAYSSSITERPSDTSGHEIFWWDLGVPTFQLGGKPTDPDSLTDLYQPSAGLYMRRYTKGIVLLNLTAATINYTLDQDYWDCLSETVGNGVLSHLTSGAAIIIPAYDCAFLLA